MTPNNYKDFIKAGDLSLGLITQSLSFVMPDFNLPNGFVALKPAPNSHTKTMVKMSSNNYKDFIKAGDLSLGLITQSLSFVRPDFNLKPSKRFYGPQTGTQ